MTLEASGRDEGAASDGGDALPALRRRVLRGALGVLALSVPTISAVIVVSEALRGGLTVLTFVLAIYTLTFPLLYWLSPRLAFRQAAVALLALLALTTFSVLVRGGVGFGNVFLAALTLILGAIFFGRRGALGGLAAALCLLVLAGFLVVGDYVPEIPMGMWDPGQLRFWVRQVVSFVLLGSGIIVTLLYVVERLDRATARFRSLAEHEQAQRRTLEELQRERERERQEREAERAALEESRRIEALARLAGGMAHDFNNTLTVIMGTAEIVKLCSRNPTEVEAAARDIIEASRRSAELVRQLLALGRQQAGRLELVSMAPLFSRVSGAFRRVLPSDVALEISASNQDLTVFVDSSELERALFNLVVNARDAMPQGGRLAVGCEVVNVADRSGHLAEGNYVKISVSDSGEGMSAATAARVFEPFFTTKAVGEGSGLGLATVQAFARASGGDVQVTSQPGAGSCFDLYLPLARTGDVPAGVTTQPQGSTPPAPRVRSILVAEDRDDVRRTMVATLERAGFDVEEAVDGTSALARLEARRFQLLCIDGVMPGVRTAEVLERAREIAPNTPVLLCSGYLQDELLRRGVEAGRCAFLQKPFSADELLTAVDQLLQPPAAARGSEPSSVP